MKAIIAIIIFSTINLFAQFAGGTGTAADPYLISTPQHLDNVRNHIGTANADKHFKLINDIDLDVPPYNEGTGWVPIGLTYQTHTYFAGKFHGSFYVIKNLYINHIDSNNHPLGVFGFSNSEAEFDSVGVVNCKIAVEDKSKMHALQIGALVGGMYGGKMFRCYSTGEIEIIKINNYHETAGLVGYSEGDMEECCSSVNIKVGTETSLSLPTTEVGGLAAFCNDGTMTNCYSTGTITNSTTNKSSNAGGLLGVMTQNSKLSNCYTTSTINTTANCDGLVGALGIGGDGVGYIKNCVAGNPYIVGNDTTKHTRILKRRNYPRLMSLQNNYALSTMLVNGAIITGGQLDNEDGADKTYAQLTSQETYEVGLGWDFDSVWVMPCGGSYPIFKWQWNGEANIAMNITPNPIGFGEVEQNETKTIKVKIENPNNVDLYLHLVELANGTNFTIPPNITVMHILANDSLFVEITLNASTLGEYTDTLIVMNKNEENGCGGSFYVPINAKIIERIIPSDLTFTIRASENKLISPTKKDYEIPIYITANKDISDITIDKLILKINKQIFFPKLVDNGNIAQFYDNDTIEITINNIKIPNLIADTENILLKIKGDILLGNVDSTSINLTEAEFSNIIEMDSLSLIDGYLTIEICEVPDDRLVDISNKNPGVFVIENPVDEVLKVKCVCIERGNYTLSIVDLLGNTEIVKEWKVTNTKQNEYEFDDINISNYGNGNYFIIMTAPNSKFYDKFNVVW